MSYNMKLENLQTHKQKLKPAAHYCIVQNVV